MTIDLKTSSITIHTWTWTPYEDILKAVKCHNIKNVIIDSSDEWTIAHGFENTAFGELKEYCIANNINITVIVGAAEANYTDHIFPEGRAEGIDIKFLPLSFLVQSYGGSESVLNRASRRLLTNNKPTNLFATLVNLPHTHRCDMIDSLAELNLLEKNYYTWNTSTKEYDIPYEFKYFQEVVKHDKGNYKDTRDNFSFPDEEYFTSLFELVIESTDSVVFFSEKTWKPIRLGKPFLLFGHQHLHRELRNLGFFLFEDVVDYSFDDEPDTLKRAKLLAAELKRLSTLDLEELVFKMKPNALFNMKKAKELALRHRLDRYGIVVRKDSTLTHYANYINDFNFIVYVETNNQNAGKPITSII